MAIIIAPSDGGHGLSDATPTDVDANTPGAAGTGTSGSRDDHRHPANADLATQAELDAVKAQITSITTGTPSLTFGTKITPGSPPNGGGRAVDFAHDGSAIAVAHDTSPRLSVYPWDGLAFGSRVQPSVNVPASNPVEVKFSPGDDFIAVFGPASNSKPFTIYSWDGASVGAGVEAANIVPLARGGAWTPDGSHVIVAEGTGGAAAYPWDGSTIGTKVTQTGIGEVFDVAVSPNGDYIAVGHASSPHVSVYQWDGAAWGTKVSDPSTLPPAANVTSVEWSRDGAYLVISSSGTPRVISYEWTGSAFGARHDIGATIPTSPPNDIEFSPSGSYIGEALTASPYIEVRPVAANGDLGDALSPAALPGLGWDGSFSPDGSHLAIAHDVTPFVTVIPGDRVIGF